MRIKSLFTIVALGSIFFTSCRETVTEREVIRERDVEKVEVKEEKEGIIERTGKEIDREVNKEIDKEIQKIGGDN